MSKYIKALSFITSLAFISQATAAENNASCSEDIANLKKQVTLLQNGLHNLNAFRVVGRDSVFNELKTKLETLTMNYELLERRVDSLTKNDNFTMSNPCDQWARMPGAIKLEFTNADYIAGTIHNHSIPIDTSVNYNAYAVCFYDDVKYKGGQKSRINLSNNRIYDVIPNNNYENFSCSSNARTEINSGAFLSIAKLKVEFDKDYLKRLSNYESCSDSSRCQKYQLKSEKNNSIVEVNQLTQSYYKNLNNYAKYAYFIDSQSYIKDISAKKFGNSNKENNFKVVKAKCSNGYQCDNQYNYYHDEEITEIFEHNACKENFTVTYFNDFINKTNKYGTYSSSKIGYLETNTSESIDLRIIVDKYSSKLNLFLVPLKY